MKNRILAALLALVLMIPMLAVTASADCGPKPSTVLTVHGGGGERMVLTLLGEQESYGPNWRIEPDSEPESYMVSNDVQEEAWYAFRDYQDPDGFCFWGEVWENSVSWTYWPPEVFKIAVYYPDYDVLLVSEDTYERYAFHSDYRLTLPVLGEEPESGTLDMVLKKESDIAQEIAGLILRIVLTIVVELSLAGVFGFRSRNQQRTILRVNLITQLGLNVLLWAWYYFDGPLEAMLRLAVAELIVLIAEAALYLRLLRQEESSVRTVLYTICANVVSVLIGFLLLA